jgi:hypothetical protein
MSSLSNNERLQLKKMVSEMGSVDNSEIIRKLKHSVAIRDGVRILDNLKKEHNELRLNNFDEFRNICVNECSFLYNNYSDIFNGVVKDELDLTILTKLLTVLKLIEDNKIDQNEGSVMVGKILKEMYIDTALKRSDNLDKEHGEDKVEENEGKQLSWKEYKNLNA